MSIVVTCQLVSPYKYFTKNTKWTTTTIYIYILKKKKKKKENGEDMYSQQLNLGIGSIWWIFSRMHPWIHSRSNKNSYWKEEYNPAWRAQLLKPHFKEAPIKRLAAHWAKQHPIENRNSWLKICICFSRAFYKCLKDA
jgi:hypothetical protein